MEVSQSTAVQLCIAIGGYLAEIESDAEYNSILPLLEFEAKHWIAGSDKRIEGTFEFERSGVAMTYFKWAVDQPETGSFGQAKDCIVFKLGAWYDNRCHMLRIPICEHPP